MIKEGGVDIVLLQETKRGSMEEEFIKLMWPFEKMEFMGVDAEGTAGGLLCIWNPDRFRLKECCTQEILSCYQELLVWVLNAL